MKKIIEIIAAAVTIVGIISIFPLLKAWFFEPALVLQNIDVYTIEVNPDVYQIGLIAQIANLDDRAHLLTKVSFDGASIDIAGRGSANIQEIHQPIAFASLSQTVLLKPNDSDLVKLLLPLRIHMHINNLPPPEFVLFGRWLLRIKSGFLSRNQTKVFPQTVGNFESVLLIDNWNNNQASELLERYPIKRKLFPNNFQRNNHYKSYLLYNPDYSASIDIYGFDKTIEVKNSKGVMLFMRGTTKPNLPDGWKILGSDYPSIWSNSSTSSIYNSIYPPDEKGHPRPFAVFAGCEEEMGVSVPVPTTTGRDILNLPLIERSQFDPNKPMYIDLRAGIKYKYY